MSTKNILFLSKSESSASTRYRALAYYSALEKAGWAPSHLGFYSGIFGKLKILKQAKKSDVVVILRHGLSFPFLQLLRLCSKKLIFDFDDAVFLKSSGNPSSIRTRRFDHTVSRCDQVWAGNHYLADRARQVNSNVFILPTSVEMSHYDGSSPKPSEYIDLVWIGSQSTGKYLKEILPVLEQATQKEPRLRLKIIADFSLQSNNLPILSIPWSKEREVQELQSAHIGIAPMPDTPWTRGKCALKVLQYMASRLPVVSSSSGANKEVIIHNTNGLLASSDEDWISAITLLSKSEKKRSALGKAGYNTCREKFSQTSCSRIILELLGNL